jgi:DNA end-binding protein Ku
MKAVWKGAISFGLVSIEVKMYPATRDKSIRFRLLHRECLAPVKYNRVCSKCGKVLKPEEIVKGFEYAPGKFIPVEEHELDSIPLPTIKAISLMEFVNQEEIDPVFYNKAYYLIPTEISLRAYQLLRDALKTENKVGIGKVVMRGKEHLVAIRAIGDVLLLSTMFYADEILQIPDPIVHAKPLYTPEELEMAKELIEKKTKVFKPEEFKDEYREKLLALLRGKIKKTEAPAVKAKSLMESLKKSLNAETSEKLSQ